ncbi:MAG: hypothetical protein CSA96_07035 [Bacteroidetes bacterium]|nr:MAG: hypothetical protein CSA96_07035 [Bacteroidota bacterium]
MNAFQHLRIFAALLLALNLFMPNPVLGHSGKPKFHVVIDTDGAIDDMRALTILLASDDVRVLAITCSGGTLPAQEVSRKVRALLGTFHHEGVPVGISGEPAIDLPPWAGFAKAVSWGTEESMRNVPAPVPSDRLLQQVLATYSEKVSFLALGSLATYARLFSTSPELKDKVERILWYNEHQIEEGFNYRCDPAAFKVIQGTKLPLVVLDAGDRDYAFNQSFIDRLVAHPSSYAEHILRVHKQDQVASKVGDGHLKLWDDLLPVYLNAPVLFDLKKEKGMDLVSLNPALPTGFLQETIAQILASSNATNNRVFSSFPLDTALYKPAYAGILAEVSGKYGLQEWKAICMTNEIHGHTGIYSIIGAKAGIRAMEYFNVGINNLEILSFAGNRPPFSCFNDGLQISTGSTIGQGLISVSDSISRRPSLIFSFNGRKARLELSAEIAQRMKADIAYGVRTYGLKTDAYWLYVEELAQHYWVDMDRFEIFSLEALN